VTALSAPVPLLSLPGEPLRTVSRSTMLVVDSSVILSACLSSTASLSYSWGVSTANGSISTGSLKSISRDPSKFILSAYSLQAGITYTVVLSLGGASASVGILVAVGSVHCVVSGGLFRSMREHDTLTLDASPSYDEDVAAQTGVRAGLRFAWYYYIW
jgi:REJ domain